MKFKYLTKEQILISLDRLTRFKNTKEKYMRVFSDILITCLLEPKLKKSDIEKLDFSIIADYVTEIFNESLKELGFVINLNQDLNFILRNYENKIFNNDSETQKLLNNNIDLQTAAKLITDASPINLKWLKHISKNISLEGREEYLLKYPIEEVILVEGITEEILLPAFSKLLGYDFYAKGIQIIPAGGKNQVVKMYYNLAKELKIPIFVLLDKDAEENISQIKPRLRKQDRIHLVSCGEFEDLLPKNLIIRTVNSHFKNFISISEDEFIEELPTAKILDLIFKKKGLHEFKKAEFAKLVRENIISISDVSPEIIAIIEEISITNKVLDT